MFRFAAEPFFFERAKHENAKETYAFVMKYFVIVMLLVYLVINLYLNGIQYIVAANFRGAIMVVPIVSMGYLLYGIYVNHSIWFKLNDLTRFGVYITIIGALVTVLINVLLIPFYGYMASAWAHIASYGTMIIVSFYFAETRYKINYNMKALLPYFGIALAMTFFGIYFPYPNLLAELAINTLFILLFIWYAQYKDNLINVFFKK
jgi:O-antigen/teichoic acid export membrane protein